jgi:hypothetical protein
VYFLTKFPLIVLITIAEQFFIFLVQIKRICQVVPYLSTDHALSLFSNQTDASTKRRIRVNKPDTKGTHECECECVCVYVPFFLLFVTGIFRLHILSPVAPSLSFKISFPHECECLFVFLSLFSLFLLAFEFQDRNLLTTLSLFISSRYHRSRGTTPPLKDSTSWVLTFFFSLLLLSLASCRR